MKKDAQKTKREKSIGMASAYEGLDFDQQELKRAGQILNQIRGLKSPQKEIELVRLVMAEQVVDGPLSTQWVQC